MRVLFFAQLKDATGCGECSFGVGEPLSEEGLWRELGRQFPGLERYRSVVRLARNGEYAGAGAFFGEGDEVALIPPVSGG